MCHRSPASNIFFHPKTHTNFKFDTVKLPFKPLVIGACHSLSQHKWRFNVSFLGRSRQVSRPYSRLRLEIVWRSWTYGVEVRSTYCVIRDLTVLNWLCTADEILEFLCAVNGEDQTAWYWSRPEDIGVRPLTSTELRHYRLSPFARWNRTSTPSATNLSFLEESMQLQDISDISITVECKPCFIIKLQGGECLRPRLFMVQ